MIRVGWLCLVGALVACGDQPGVMSDMAQPPDLAPVTVQLSGAAQKGPFVLGSTVQVSLVDSAGNPTGTVFPTQTSDDLGEFSLQLSYQGLVSIEATGYYYNEATGKLSDSSLTLRAFYDVTTSGTQSAYVNIVTHLTYERVKALLAGPPTMSLADATAQAESELRTSLTIGGPGFDPMATGIEMNIAGGDNDANAYLFGVGAIFSEVAVATAGGASVDATLQQLINTTASYFATNMDIPQALVLQIKAAQRDNDYHKIMNDFALRLLTTGSTSAVPDLGRVWDTDGDTVVDNSDNCPWIPNKTQMPVNGLCGARMHAYPFSYPNGPIVNVLGKFNGDANTDILYAETSLQIFAGDGAGGLNLFPTTSVPLTDSVDQCGPPTSLACDFPGPNPLAFDVDGDGNLDLVASILTHDGNTGVFYGDGAGGFSAPVPVINTPIQHDVTNSYSRFNWFAVADFDKDGNNDVVGAIGGQSDQLWFVPGTGSRTFGAPVQISFGTSSIYVWRIVVADFTGDTFPDLVLSSQSNGAPGVSNALFLFTNNGTTGPTFNGFTPSAIGSVTNMQSLAVGDFDGNSVADLVVANTSTIQPLFGDGAGGFTPGTALSVAIGASGINLLAGDFTGDGKDDVMYNDTINSAIVLGVSNGSGFQLVNVPFLSASGLILAGDLNNDGKMDAVLFGGNGSAQTITTVLLNP
jgi:hypothetical protein